MTIPCTENKCILYPLCISKINIYCSTLYDYFNQLTEQGLSNKEVWDIIHRKLRAHLIYSTDEAKDPITTLTISQDNPVRVYDSPIE